MAKTPLAEAYGNWIAELYANAVEGRDEQIIGVIRFLGVEAENEHLLSRDEAVSLAKKILCRGLNAEYTRAEAEAFLKG